MTIYFLFLIFRIVKVWKKWPQALIRWKNTIVISVVFLIACMALVYSSVDWKDSLFISSSKICTVLIMCNVYVNLLLWLYLSKKPVTVEEEPVDNQDRSRGASEMMNDSTFINQDFDRQDSRAVSSHLSRASTVNESKQKQLFVDKK